MRNLRLSCAIVALISIPAAAFAQSTGSREFDEDIVVSAGSVARGINGVVIPDTQKTKAVLTSDFIQHQTAGQSINEIINQLPGVSFQNNDPYGSAGGTLNIRGFDGSRISQTFDGIPLNDTGNYAIYSNQQVDSELIDQVSVNLGSTDVDSPTASATGSTVNYTTRKPTEDFHIRSNISFGEYNYKRIFGVVDTGVFGPWGTSAWIAASHGTNDVPFNHYGKINKDQYNAKIYQPIGSSGDFVSVAAHYNENRNNFFGSIPLRTDRTQSPTNLAPRVVGTAATNRFPTTADERDYPVNAPCTTDAPQAGIADAPNTCGTSYDERFNPSNTANVRVNSRFSLSDKLVLTVDPFYQYTKANGGGSVNASESRTSAVTTGSAQNPAGLIGYIGGVPYAGGVDLNGDGDVLDRVTMLAPSTTVTNRFGVIANLRYEFSDTQTVRVNYTLDYGHHRQTGEIAPLNADGTPTEYFPIDNPISDSTGHLLQKRDRLSKAILNQVSGEYRGKFFDEKLTLTGGVRAPFFQRKLNNYCFATNATGFVDCFGQNAAANTAYATLHPNYAAPQKRDLKYNKILPSGGFVFNATSDISLYGSYSKSVQVPGTDNLYNSFWFPVGTDAAKPKPESTDNFDTGVRFKSGQIQASVAGWYTNFKNRLASSFDPIENVTVYRNLGTVHKYGVDVDLSYNPIQAITLRAFGSYLKSKILDDVQTGGTAAAPTFALTGGKRESGAPKFTLGANARGTLGPVELGVQYKRTGPRFINDQNLPVFQNNIVVYGAKTPSYNIVDFDVRVHVTPPEARNQTYLQLNVTNLFDKFYVGGFGGTTANNATSFVQIGAPRAISGTVTVSF